MIGFSLKKLFQQYLHARQQPSNTLHKQLNLIELIVLSEYLHTEAMKVKGKIVAHDIRNALSSIDISLPFVEDQSLQEKIQDKTRVIKETLHQIDEKSENTYTFVKIQDMVESLKEIDKLTIEPVIFEETREVLMQKNMVVSCFSALVAVISQLGGGEITLQKDDAGMCLSAALDKGSDRIVKLMDKDSLEEADAELRFYARLFDNAESILKFNRIYLTPKVSGRKITVYLQIT